MFLSAMCAPNTSLESWLGGIEKRKTVFLVTNRRIFIVLYSRIISEIRSFLIHIAILQ